MIELSGYDWNDNQSTWEKVLEENTKTLPTAGAGSFIRIMVVEGESESPYLYEQFLNGQLSAWRKIKPYPLNRTLPTEVEANFIPSPGQGSSLTRRITLYIQPDCQPILSLRELDTSSAPKRNVSRADYGFKGDLMRVFVKPPLTAPLNFLFLKGVVKNREGREITKIPNGSLEFSFDERWFVLNQTQDNKKLEVVYPVGEVTLFSGNYPSKIPVERVSNLLTQDSPDWLIMPQEFPHLFPG